MFVRRGRPIVLFTHESDFPVMKSFETRSVSGMDYHCIGQKITHVLHHSELTEFVER